MSENLRAADDLLPIFRPGIKDRCLVELRVSSASIKQNEICSEDSGSASPPNVDRVKRVPLLACKVVDLGLEWVVKVVCCGQRALNLQSRSSKTKPHPVTSIFLPFPNEVKVIVVP